MNNKNKSYPQIYHFYLLTITISLIFAMSACTNKPKPVASVATNPTPVTTPTVIDPNQLQVGKPVERELAGGDVHSYTIQLETNQYLNAVVEQKGIDVVASIYNPAGEKVYEVDSPNGDTGPEPIYLISQTSGTYRLEIRSLEKGAKPGKYEAKVAELRASVAEDADRIAGFKALGEAVLLQAEGKKENVPLFIKKYEEAIEKLEKAGESLAQANTLNGLGQIYSSQGNYLKAEPLYLQALEICEKMLGDNHPDTVYCYNNLISLYFKTVDYRKAIQLTNQVLQSRKKVLGEEHTDIAQLLNNLAVLYFSNGEYSKAEPLYIKSLEIYKKVLGEEHTETISSFSNLAQLYKLKRDYEKAEYLYTKILHITQNTLGINHPDTANFIHNLGLIYYEKGSSPLNRGQMK